MKIIKFEDLEIWKQSLTITRNVYDLLAKKEFNLEFELKNQIKRAVISISSNIVEGFEKNNNNEFIRFLKISKDLLEKLGVKYILLSQSNELVKKNSILLMNLYCHYQTKLVR